MKPLSLCLLLSLPLLLSSCARFNTRQTDNRYENGKLSTSIETKASTYTFFSSKSRLTQFKASQTEKTQSATVGSLDQQGGTNAVATLRALADLLQALPIR